MTNKTQKENNLLLRFCKFPIRLIEYYCGSVYDALLYVSVYLIAPLWIIFHNYYGLNNASGYLTADNCYGILKTAGTIAAVDIGIFVIWWLLAFLFKGFVRKMGEFWRIIVRVWEETKTN